MELTTDQYILAIAGGFIAGIMNTLAGYGSVITLTILMDVIGLPATIANGTNRVNVFTGVIASGLGFYKNGKLDFTKGKWVIAFTFIGAVVGVLVAINVSNEQFKSIFKYLVAVLFIIVLVNPKRWLREQSEDYEMPVWLMIVVFIPLGFYGGFIQMGMGLFFVAATVLLGRYTMIESNALKVTVVGLYTLMSLILFHINGLINWQVGAIIGIGAALGGYITAHYASKYKNANLWAYRLLVLIIVIILLRSFGVWDIISNSIF